MRQVLSVTAVFLCISQWVSAQVVLRESLFDSSTEGWTCVRLNNADCVMGPNSPAVAQSFLSWQPTGGNPGGFFQHVDPNEGETSFFKAPESFLGDLSAAYQGSLSFDLKQSNTANQYNTPEVFLQGGGLSLYCEALYHPRTTWSHFHVVLGEGATWHVGTCGGPVATAQQVQQVLSSVTAIFIRAEFMNTATPDTDGIDNVRIYGPAPQSVTSTFDTSDEGWWVIGDSTAPTWNAATGNPGGAIQATDQPQNINWYFVAPGKFFGNRLSMIGSVFAFDLKSPGTDLGPDPVFIVSGATESLLYNIAGFPQGNVWSRHAIRLAPGEGWTRASDGMAATLTDFQSVFSSIGALFIRAEYTAAADTDFLDNVVFGSCAPTAFVSPLQQCGEVGANLQFQAEPIPDASYQWRKGGAALVDGNGVVGSTTSTLLLSPADTNADGLYDCVVTNECGAVVSNDSVIYLRRSVAATRALPVQRLVCLENLVVTNPIDLTESAGNASITAEDASGALTIFGSTSEIQSLLNTIAPGDTISNISGKTSFFNGLTEIENVTQVQSGNSAVPVIPIAVTAADFATDSPTAEGLESRLVIARDYVFSQVGQFVYTPTNLYLNDGIPVRLATSAIAASLNSSVGGIPTGAPVDVIGVFTQFDSTAPYTSGYQFAVTQIVRHCDSIDMNNDTSLFDPQDIEAFLSVYSEGPCVPASATCGDIDFNNDTSLFDPCDINSFLVMYSEGPCTLCGQ